MYRLADYVVMVSNGLGGQMLFVTGWQASNMTSVLGAPGVGSTAP